MMKQSLNPSFEPLCTLVIPTYNAAGFIDATVQRLRQFVAEQTQWRVLFVCDGCTDSTVSGLRELLADCDEWFDVEAYPENRGKGYALRRGLSLAQTPFLVYTDVDLAYDPNEALKILQLLENGADLAVVNRADPQSRFLMSPSDFSSIYRRHRMSRVFNWWLRMMLPITIRDTQAGLKGMTAQTWRRLAPNMVSDGFFFDVELLAWAGEMKLATAETPINFRYVDPTTVRMLRHGRNMILETFRLRRALRRAPAPVSAEEPCPQNAVEG